MSSWCLSVAMPHLCLRSSRQQPSTLTMRDRCVTPGGGSAGPASYSSNGAPRTAALASSSSASSRHCSPHHTALKTRQTLSSLPARLPADINGGSKPTRLPVPRQSSDSCSDALQFDKIVQQQLLQDCTNAKSLLLQLQTILLDADNAAPLITSECGSAEVRPSSDDSKGRGDAAESVPHLRQQNTDLKRQVYLLQQQLEERERSLARLQQRLVTCGGENRMTRSLETSSAINAATQTERSGRIGASLTRPPSVDDGLGPTVSSEKCTPPTSAGPDHQRPQSSSRLQAPRTIGRNSGGSSAVVRPRGDDRHNASLTQLNSLPATNGTAGLPHSKHDSHHNNTSSNNRNKNINFGSITSIPSQAEQNSYANIHSNGDNISESLRPVVSNGHHSNGSSESVSSRVPTAGVNGASPDDNINTATNGRAATSPSGGYSTFSERKKVFFNNSSSSRLVNNNRTSLKAAKQPS